MCHLTRYRCETSTSWYAGTVGHGASVGTDLDDQGQILVNAIDDDTGRSQAFILSMVSGTGQVPEPQSLALTLLALAMALRSNVRRGHRPTPAKP